MRSTKIICTIGPASDTKDGLLALLDAGMDIARINFSHGTHEKSAEIITTLRALDRERGTATGIMIDTKGGEIRTGDVPHPIEITKGQEVIFSSRPISNKKETMISVNYENFFKDVVETDRILIDSGEITFDVVKINDDGTVVGRAQNAGIIGSRRHITLPGADIDLPSVTDKDWEDIAFGAEMGADFVALSFVRTGDDVRSVRKFLEENGSPMHIVSKIESQRAIDNLAEIIEASDAIMVARGDLGSDIAFEELPALQDETVTRCRDLGIPVIVATHMLESMIEHPVPTRAEVTDVAHAAMTGADAAMLSGETAVGKYPIRAVEAMARTLIKTEEHLRRFPHDIEIPVHDDREARAEAAVSLASTTAAQAILVFTRTGQTAREVTKFRPSAPVIALTATESVRRQLSLVYGVRAVMIPFSKAEDTVQIALQTAEKMGLITKGQQVVLLSDTDAKDSPVSSVQVRTV
jgi:pyruvate kinase